MYEDNSTTDIPFETIDGVIVDMRHPVPKNVLIEVTWNQRRLRKKCFMYYKIYFILNIIR